MNDKMVNDKKFEDIVEFEHVAVILFLIYNTGLDCKLLGGPCKQDNRHQLCR